MKLKNLILSSLFCLTSLSANAENMHLHPIAEDAKSKPVQAETQRPGYCQIEIINKSYEDVIVNGVFDDGSSLYPFRVYSFEAPHYISLYYYGYCHSGMELDIDTISGYHLYGGYTRADMTIKIVPYMSKAKAEVTSK